jgi:hypothetical protein
MDKTYRDITVGNTTYIMDEDRAIDLLNAMSQEFGWATTVFISNDIREQINNRREADDLEPLAGKELDDAVDAVWNSGYWDEMPELMCRAGWDSIDAAIFDEIESR